MQRRLAFSGKKGRRLFLESWSNNHREPLGSVVLVQPFGEEMNRSRRILKHLGAQLGSAGMYVVLPDFFGTGDSEGEFGDASVEIWLEDLESIIDTLPTSDHLHVIGLRFGALLIAKLSHRHRFETVTLVQPILKGDELLRLLLRTRLAGNMFHGDKKETSESLSATIASGEPLEFGGYEISPELFAQIGQLSLDQMDMSFVNRLHVVEAGTHSLSASVSSFLSASVGEESRVKISVVDCSPFWAAQEIADCEELTSIVARFVV